MNQRLLALYGLKWNPFSPELPTEAIFVPPKLENFCWRIEHAQIREGGFAMIHGDPGTGKSIALRLLAERLSKLCDVTVGAVNHPQSNLADFYRELGDIVAVALRPHNRWGGFKALRERWLAHLDTTRHVPAQTPGSGHGTMGMSLGRLMRPVQVLGGQRRPHVPAEDRPGIRRRRGSGHGDSLLLVGTPNSTGPTLTSPVPIQ